jgi:NADH-quinone oxidoreductase subunit N
VSLLHTVTQFVALQAPEPDDRIVAPAIVWKSLAPMLCVFGAALAGVITDAVLEPARRRLVGLVVALAGLAAAMYFVIDLWGQRSFVAEGAVALDGPALFMQGTLVALAVASILLLGDRAGTGERDVALPSEAYPLAMFSVGGMMLFVSASNLLVLFIALEILSLPLYLLAGLARRRRMLSQESAVKYFLLGAFSSGFFLYGLALLYGYAGTISFTGIAEATLVTGRNDVLLYAGLALLGVGLLFKIGAVPFHSWTPDVYQGAPTPVTALMAAGTKVAAFGGLLRVFFVVFGRISWDWRPAMWWIAALTMLLGAIVAVTQTDVKRMLAYSSVAHAGFILTGVVAANRNGLRGAMFYLLAYGFTVLGAFGIVTLVRDRDGEATHLSKWQGLGRRSPLVAGVFALFLFALAGIPLTSGFSAKFSVFQAAVEGHATALVIIGVVSSAIAAFFYARVVVLMFFQEPAETGPEVVVPGGMTAASLAIAVFATVYLGVAPGALLRLAENAKVFLR